MARYRKKPIVVEAEQFLPWTGAAGAILLGFPVQRDDRGPYIIIPTLEGDHRANAGDWIITGVKGEKYPCKPDIFASTYEPFQAAEDDEDDEDDGIQSGPLP